MSRPNVLLIIADDWSPLARCYGNEVVRTPNIDRFAERSTVFDHAFCASPSCAVSRANILTGQHAHSHGQYGHTHGQHGFNTFRSVVSLPRVLDAHGYRTTNIGKHHVAPDSVYPFHVREPVDLRSSRAMADLFRTFLQETGDTPFFTMYAPAYPHRKGNGAGYGLDEYTDEFNDQPIDPADVVVPDFLPDLPAVRDDLAAYYTAVARYDHCVGEALAVLEESGQADNTLVLVLSDHGMPFPGAKATSFDTGHHCPLIVHRPDGPGQRVHNNALVNWTDITPTIYEWCGVPAERWPTSLQGRSFLPLLGQRGGDASWDETIFSHCFHGIREYFPYRVLRGRRYKYVRNLAYEMTQPLASDLARSSTWQAVCDNGVAMMGQRPTRRLLRHDREALFDMQADPMETRNLIDEPALAATAARMRETIQQFRTNTNDPWLDNDAEEQLLARLEASSAASA